MSDNMTINRLRFGFHRSDNRFQNSVPVLALDFTPICCIEFVSKLSRQSVSMKFASSLSVNCHDSPFHRLPTIS